MNSLRSRVAELMVETHKISPEVASAHVREMEASEVKRRFLMYVRERIAPMELKEKDPS
jgi:DNA-binding Lrp family transcriptional regulator